MSEHRLLMEKPKGKTQGPEVAPEAPENGAEGEEKLRDYRDLLTGLLELVIDTVRLQRFRPGSDADPTPLRKLNETLRKIGAIRGESVSKLLGLPKATFDGRGEHICIVLYDESDQSVKIEGYEQLLKGLRTLVRDGSIDPSKAVKNPHALSFIRGLDAGLAVSDPEEEGPGGTGESRDERVKKARADMEQSILTSTLFRRAEGKQKTNGKERYFRLGRADGKSGTLLFGEVYPVLHAKSLVEQIEKTELEARGYSYRGEQEEKKALAALAEVVSQIQDADQSSFQDAALKVLGGREEGERLLHPAKDRFVLEIRLDGESQKLLERFEAKMKERISRAESFGDRVEDGATTDLLREMEKSAEALAKTRGWTPEFTAKAMMGSLTRRKRTSDSVRYTIRNYSDETLNSYVNLEWKDGKFVLR